MFGLCARVDHQVEPQCLDAVEGRSRDGTSSLRFGLLPELPQVAQVVTSPLRGHWLRLLFPSLLLLGVESSHRLLQPADIPIAEELPGGDLSVALDPPEREVVARTWIGS